MELDETTALHVAGITSAGATAALAQALETRKDILHMTQQAEDAVLMPQDPGAWSAALRQVLAARIARLNGDEAAATFYAQRVTDRAYAALEHPDQTQHEHVNPAVIRFVDQVSTAPRTIRADDIAQLQAQGVADADIVRMCELVAFMGYQLRVISGLRLLKEAA